MEWLVSGVVLLLTLAGALLGRRYGAKLPQHHLGEDSKYVVKGAMGMVATLAALVLGLVTASAKSNFDDAQDGVHRIAADIVGLDRLLVRYGPETAPIRGRAREALAMRIDEAWPANPAAATRESIERLTVAVESIEDAIAGLSPTTDAQRLFKQRALDMSADLLHARWTVLTGADQAPQPVFVAVLVLWLVILLASFGVFAPRNTLALYAIVACAVSVASAILLIFELDRPFSGLIQLSGAPLRIALSQIGA